MPLSKAAREANRRALVRQGATCRHFTGLINETCEAGVNYRELGDDSRPGVVLRLPCAPPLDRADPAEIVTCDKRHETGMELALEREREREAAWKRIGLARAEIVKRHEGQVNQKGSIDCPTCGAALFYEIHGNGHVWGICSTEGCCSWME